MTETARAAAAAGDEHREGTSEAQLRFLLRLSDRLRRLDDPDAIPREAAHALGAYLGASRVGYSEAQDDGKSVVVLHDCTDGVRGIAGRHRLDDFGADLAREFRAGRTVGFADVARDPRLTDAERAAHAALEIGASANVPLVKGGRLVALLFVHHRGPRAYRPEEASLAESAAARTWDAVVRARAEAALREGETRFRLALDIAELGTWTIDLPDGSGDLVAESAPGAGSVFTLTVPRARLARPTRAPNRRA